MRMFAAASGLLTALLITVPVLAAGGTGQHTIILIAQSATAVSPSPGPPMHPDRLARARENYVALRDGRRSVSDLTPEELQDVLDFDRMLRGEAVVDTRTPKQQCIDNEVRRAGGRPSRLDRQVIALKCR